MESSEIKVCQIQARKVAQDILMSVWHKQDIISSEPSPKLTFVPEITEKFMKNLCDMVWDETVRKGRVWENFSKRHFKRMTEAPFQFTNYVAYASYLSIEKSTNAQACFLDILSLVIQFTLYCWDQGEEHDKFLNTTIELFSAFFDKELCTKFEEQGGWVNFSKLETVDALSVGEYVVNGVVLSDITEDQVENNEQAVTFADSVRNIVNEAYEKEFEDILKDFEKTDSQLERLYCGAVGVACDGMVDGEDRENLTFSNYLRMDSTKYEECKIQARMVAQHALMSLWHKQLVISKKPERKSSFPPEINEKFLENLILVVWIESIRKGHIWEDFLFKHFERMIITPSLFTKYVAYACYLSIETETDAQTCFLDILSLLAYFTLHFSKSKHKKFLNTCLELFCAFFNKEICTKFEEQGRWKNFNEFLERQKFLKEFRELGEHKFFVNFEYQHYMHKHKLYVINDVVLIDITEDQVENNEQAVTFANSVTNIVYEAYKMEFDDILQDFERTDSQLQRLYCETVGVELEAGGDQSSQEVKDEALKNVSSVTIEKTEERMEEGSDPFENKKEVVCETVGVACDRMANGKDQYSLQKVQDEGLKNTPSLLTSENIENQAKIGKDFYPLEANNIGFSKPTKFVPDPLFKFENIEKAVALLREMIDDTKKISELIKFVCR